MATIKDVAEEAGVSVATVSHVINGTRYVSPELTQKVEEAMEDLDYHPNAVARSLKTQKTHTLGLVVSDITNLFFPALARGVEEIASKKGYSLFVSNTDELLEMEKFYLDSLIEKRVDGIVIAPTGQSNQKFQLLRKKNIPFVLVDRKLKNVKGDLVCSENIEGGYQATKYLIDNGHERIGIILGLKSVSTSQERFKGYKEALDEVGIELDKKLVARSDYRIEGGIKAAQQLLSLKQPPTAIFSTNVMSNLGALKAIKKRGLRCPEDISLVGFDDFEWAETCDPPLTVVAQQPYEIGYRAGKLLFDKLEGKEKGFKEIRLKTTLNIRESVSKVSNRLSDLSPT